MQMTEDHHSHTGRRSLLIVHGRGFKPAANELLDLSVEAMRYGMQRDYPDCAAAFDVVEKELVYYGDLSNKLLQSLGKSYDAPLDLGDRQNALRALKEVTERKRFDIRRYDRLPGKSAFKEGVASTLYPLLCLVGLSPAIVRTVSRDFGAYLSGGDYTAAVRSRVVDSLAAMLERDERIMLVAHGTGSAIAWDALWTLSHDEELKQRVQGRKVDVFVTLGSPLGDRHIRKRLCGAGESADCRFPTNVISWHNVSAEDDYTCHDNTLADDFKKMMSDHIVSAVRDYKITNHAVRYGCSNPHSSVGYYIHPRMAKIIADWIGPPPEPPPREITEG